jgi:hypothetical protein
MTYLIHCCCVVEANPTMSEREREMRERSEGGSQKRINLVMLRGEDEINNVFREYLGHGQRKLMKKGCLWREQELIKMFQFLFFRLEGFVAVKFYNLQKINLERGEICNF